MGNFSPFVVCYRKEPYSKIVASLRSQRKDKNKAVNSTPCKMPTLHTQRSKTGILQAVDMI